MPLRVLLVQSEAPVAEWLIRYFTGRGDQAWQASSPSQALSLLEKIQPELVVLDLHFPGNAWLELLRRLSSSYPLPKIMVTNKRPAFHRELQAREFGARICVRQPLSQDWMDQALKMLAETPQAEQPIPVRAATAPTVKVKVPMRGMIILPYSLLALLFTLVGAYLSSQVTPLQIVFLGVSALLLVILTGLVVANQITRPLQRVVDATAQVARGSLDVKIEPRGHDEVAVLGHAFNAMVAGLQEGSIYRELLGRTVSPEVREQFRQAFNSGSLRLEGQQCTAAVLVTRICSFTSLSENADPAAVFRWLNEYYGALLPDITANGGVVNQIDGDGMLAFFGILPRSLYPKESALAACTAAVEMLKAVDELNARRVERGEQPLVTGIGINTGPVFAGGLGSSDWLHFTLIGDTVDAARRLEGLNRQHPDSSGALVGGDTYQALAEQRSAFGLESMGLQVVKDQQEQVEVYRLLGMEPTSLPEGRA